MKKIKFLFLLVILVAPSLLYFYSCNKIKELAVIDVTYKLPKISFHYVPVLLKTGEVELYSGSIKINLDSLLNHYGLSAGTLESVAFSNFSITITAPSNANFDWLTSANALVSQNSSFQPNSIIATVENPGSGNKTVVLTTNNTNIVPYLNSTQFYLKVTATTTGTIPYEWIDMYLNSTLQLVIQPI